MRKCIRCGCEMKENCAVKIEGAGYGIVLSSDENKLFGGRIGKPRLGWHILFPNKVLQKIFCLCHNPTEQIRKPAFAFN